MNPSKGEPSAPSASGTRRVLLVDDDKKLCRLLAEYLKPLGYAIVAAHNGPDGVERALTESWHAVILDVMLPGMDGIEVLRRIRVSSDVPVLMLTARGEETDRIVGLEIGADDYLPKTFSSRELLARLRSVTRRSYRAPSIQPVSDADIVVGKLRVVPSARGAFLDEVPLGLTPVEYDLLLCLARSCGRVKTRDQLLEEIRERDYEVFDRSIDVHISALRKKLGDDAKNPRFIRTFRSAGYMLIHPESP
ncbi:MAG: response regulator transcription factor [Methylacidiphilales bacterium]|nr:response regulator transcription factor [Candidatus Methylacidiphilales bacterium]